MTYRYAKDDIDCEGKPIGATCDFCDRELHVDEWQDCEDGLEHTCSDCRILGNRERAEHEWAHARGRI